MNDMWGVVVTAIGVILIYNLASLGAVLIIAFRERVRRRTDGELDA